MNLSQGMSLRLEQALILPMHVMCMIPLFSLSLKGLKQVKDYIEGMSPEELEAIGNISYGGSGKKAFYDGKLESLLSDCGASSNEDPDVRLRNYNGEIVWDFENDLGEKYKVGDEESDAGLIRNPKLLIRNINWVDSAVRRIYEIVLNHQKDYLLTNRPEKLRPITQGKVAQQMGLSDSTISRLFKRRTLRSLDGHIMPLNSLVVQQEDINRMRVFEIMGTMVRNGTYPKSDDDAVIAIYEKTGGEDNGIMLARRTITKYRRDRGEFNERDGRVASGNY